MLYICNDFKRGIQTLQICDGVDTHTPTVQTHTDVGTRAPTRSPQIPSTQSSNLHYNVIVSHKLYTRLQDT